MILNSLTTLGVRHIRDGLFDHPESSPYTQKHHALALAGIKTTYVVQALPSETSAKLAYFAGNVDDLEAFEAPNECDALLNCNGGETAGINQVLSLLPQISAAASLTGAPVIGPSFVFPESYAQAGNLSELVAYSNLHVYFGGFNPGSAGWGGYDNNGNAYGSLKYWLDAGEQTTPNAPAMITETGYMSYATPTTSYTVSETVAGKYIPRTLLLAFAHGVKRTYVYELLDEFSSPGYGLIRSDLSPKPQYNVIKGLIDTLSDQGPAFSAGALSYSLEGGDSTVNHLLLQKRDGSFWLILWLEQSCFDRVSLKNLPVASQALTLNIGGGKVLRQVTTFDDAGNTVQKGVSKGNGSSSVTITDQVSILEIGN